MNKKLAAKLSQATKHLEKAQIAMAEATRLTEESSYGREVDKLCDQVTSAYNDAAYFAERVIK